MLPFNLKNVRGNNNLKIFFLKKITIFQPKEQNSCSLLSCVFEQPTLEKHEFKKFDIAQYFKTYYVK